MKNLLRKWVKALRSGKYHQTRDKLCEIRNGQAFHCCLGVACRVAKKEGLGVKAKKLPYSNEVSFSYDGSTEEISILPSTLKKEFGLSSLEQDELTAMNDSGKSFKEIADYIERTFDL